MRDAKSFLLLAVTILLIATWAFHIYDKSQAVNGSAPVVIDSSAILQPLRDSFEASFDEIPVEDSADAELMSREQLAEQISTLRDRIRRILADKKADERALSEARELIASLRAKIDEYNSRDSSVDQQRASLEASLNDVNFKLDSVKTRAATLEKENKSIKEEVRNSSLFSVLEMRLIGVNQQSGNREVNTDLARKTDQFNVSFIVRNPLKDDNNAEIIAVLSDPAGKAITTQVWESGQFQLKSGKWSAFTRKLQFDYHKGEEKRVVFSVVNESVKKGQYSLQLYQHGELIGSTNLKLR